MIVVIYTTIITLELMKFDIRGFSLYPVKSFNIIIIVIVIIVIEAKRVNFNVVNTTVVHEYAYEFIKQNHLKICGGLNLP